jgi:predicted methyltransferase
MGLPSVLIYAQQLIQSAVSGSDTVVDATVGNGMDTVFLAKCVGESGKVYGFDIQQEALDNTRQRITEEGLIPLNINLINESHANMLGSIPASEQGKIAAVMFNLGYLPGCDHQIITRPESTIPALEAAVQLLRKGGIITIVLYPGHPGGQEEAEQVSVWAAKLLQREYQVIHYQFLNQRNHPPYLIAVQKIRK